MARLIVLIFISILFLNQADADLIDTSATDETVAAYEKIRNAKGSPYLWGYNNPPMYGDNASVCSKKTESYNISGKDPFLWGFMWKVPDGTANNYMNKQECINLAKKINRLGGLIVLSFNPINFVTGGDYYDATGDPMTKMLPGGSARADWLAYLDELAYFLKYILVDENGNPIPIIFKPFCECDQGSFYWYCWGINAPKYISLWQDMVSYLMSTKSVHSIIYQYSPDFGYNGTGAQDGYPGNDYVDIIGVNNYESVIENVIPYYEEAATLAVEKGKVFGISEGLKGTPDKATYWTDVLALIRGSSLVSENLSFIFFWSTDTWGPKSGRIDEASYPAFVNSPYIKTLPTNILDTEGLNINGLSIN